MKIEMHNINGKWKRYTLLNKNNMSIKFLDFGGCITEINVPDRNQHIQNVVLGYKNYQHYENNTSFLGTIIGRVAGRIKDASFTLNNQTYMIEANNNSHHLHGGSKGFHQIIWRTKPFQTENTVGVILTHRSQDGEGGYPGTVDVSVTYTLNNKNELIIDYLAKSNKATAFTLTNHSYFNLTGNLASSIHNHVVTIDSDTFVELDKELIPTGKKLDVENTPFDFRKGRKTTDGINSTYSQNLLANYGYDHYFILNHAKQDDICIKDETSGRKLTVKTNQPGVVLYTANSAIDNIEIENGRSNQHLGVCLETQASPASLHHEGFPTIILEAHETYEKQTVYTFGIEE